MATEPALRDRLARVVGDGHDAVTTTFVLLAAVALGRFVAWFAADIVGYQPAFAVGAIATAGILYTRRTRRRVLATTCYALAALVALVPLTYELTILIHTDTPLAHVLTTTDLILTLSFLTAATPIAVLGYRIATDPFIPRIHARLTDN
jgi:hypothetical protein